MADKHLSTSSNPVRQPASDLDISAILIAERLIGEILGWDLVDWPAVELHKDRKFFFGRRRRGEVSIHDQLKPLFDRCDPCKNDYSALKPSPIVNDNLSKLVGWLSLPPCRQAQPARGRSDWSGTPANGGTGEAPSDRDPPPA